MRHALYFLSGIGLLVGCGSSSIIQTPLPALQAPIITVQPASITVPLGLGLTFHVNASGSPTLAYQWQRNGVNISGANSTSYGLQSTSAADAGSTYDVIITNSAGSITSQLATITLGARSPSEGDLRFQQVDSLLTINNYTGSSSGNIVGGEGVNETNAFGIPLAIGPSCYPGAGTFGCGWIWDTLIPVGTTTSLSINYRSFAYATEDTQTALNSLFQPNIVITGMDLEPTNFCSTFSWLTQDPTLPSFTPQITSDLQPSDVQTSASAQALNGRVITAISYDGSGKVSYISYGRQNDTTQYDVQVQTATINTAATTAQVLANNGYIITAIGGNGYIGVLLVGTRVHGDTMPRPMMIIPASGTPTSLSENGYATVGVLFDGANGFVGWIGER